MASEIEMIKQKNTMLREACNIRAVRMGPPVFEYGAQQRGVEGGTIQAGLMSMSEGTEEAKLAYLRNLMVNYLSADPTVRDHMEGAIGTVLKFSPQDFKRIAEGKTSAESSWF